MNKLFIFIFIFSFIVLSCQERRDVTTQVKKVNDTLITIIFKERSFKSDTLRLKTGQYSFRDENIQYSFQDSFLSFIVSKKNYKKNDTIKIETKKDILFSHGYNVNQYSLYKFKPGDVVVFSYPNDLPICQVKNRQISYTELNFLTRLNLQTNKSEKSDFHFFLEKKRFRTLQEKATILNKYCELRRSKLDSLKQANSISSELYELFISDLKYTQDNHKEDFFNTNIDLSTPSGRNFVLKHFESMHKPNLLTAKNNSIIDSRIQFENVVTEKNLTIKNKDFLLYKYMEHILLNFSKEDITKYFEIFKKEVKDKDLIVSLNEKYLSAINNVLDINNTILENKSNKKFDLNNIIKNNFHNKIVYVDFWSSWCMPCRKLMPFSKKLHEEYKSRDVVFIYISIDEDFEKWQIASKKEGLSLDENNYKAFNYPNNLFYKEIQLKTIPRYLIYNKNGELVHKNAPSPDSNEIRVELNKYLSQ